MPLVQLCALIAVSITQCSCNESRAFFLSYKTPCAVDWGPDAPSQLNLSYVAGKPEGVKAPYQCGLLFCALHGLTDKAAPRPKLSELV